MTSSGIFRSPDLQSHGPNPKKEEHGGCGASEALFHQRLLQDQINHKVGGCIPYMYSVIIPRRFEHT